MRFVLQRLGQLVAVLLAVTALTFASVNVLGDPLVNILGPLANVDCTGIEPGSPEDVSSVVGSVVGDCERIAQERANFHLDDPLPIRYVSWLGDVVQGDFGESFQSQIPVIDVIKPKLSITLQLVGIALVLSLVIAIPWAVLAAYRANRGFDNVSTVAAFGLLSVPNFALGVILFYLFAVKWQWFPSRLDESSTFARLKSLFLPALALALPLAATYMRLLRTDLITTLQEDYIHMARAKGLPGRWVMMRHALRPSMFSICTIFGINTGALLGGSIVVEQIFSVRGVGLELIEAIVRDDPPVVLAIVTIIVTGFVVVNVLVDLLYGLLDPRIKRA